MSFSNFLFRNLSNLPGWRTNRRIVVIESDDWGTVRMPNLDICRTVISKYSNMFWAETYDRFDNLAKAEDLRSLFEVLSRHKDKNGRSAVITANTVVANPDFEKIKSSGYKEYYYEPFTKTLDRYSDHKGTIKLWQEGIKESLFYPQFHTREHLNVGMWLNALQTNQPGTREIFEFGTWPMRLENGSRLDIAYNYSNKHDLDFVLLSLVDGMEMFEKLFGFKSRSFIAPSYTWDEIIEERMALLGAKYIQGMIFQHFPQGNYNNYGRATKYNFTGRKNKFGQIYLMRNVHFEPALGNDSDLVDKVLKKIAIAFRWGKPAIISTHRLNYIGNLDTGNRDKTLKLLEEILLRITKKYPDVEFMTSDELGDAIIGERQYS